MDDLVTWLRAQLDAHELAVRDEWDGWRMERDAREVALAEVEAKRRILTLLEIELADDAEQQVPRDMVKLLALPYADRPGYREEWRPA